MYKELGDNHGSRLCDGMTEEKHSQEVEMLMAITVEVEEYNMIWIIVPKDEMENQGIRVVSNINQCNMLQVLKFKFQYWSFILVFDFNNV